MRSLRRNGDRQWRAAREWRVLCNEDTIRRQACDQKTSFMLLGERVDDATTK